jgi:putative pyruvate formate lyase activating enzyme
VFRHRVEYGEEAELVPSHLFYLSGCDLRCAFCIAGLNAFDPSRGLELEAGWFKRAVRWGQEQGAVNVQFVGGEPTIHLPSILEVISSCNELPPIVWKSDFHFTPEALSLLDGRVDVYLADFKFGNDACAKNLAGIDNYVSIISRNLKLAARQARVIVRHLLLPGHFECCYLPVARWMAQHLPDVSFSIREGYMPSWRATRMEGLSRPVEACVAAEAHRVAGNLGLTVIR